MVQTVFVPSASRLKEKPSPRTFDCKVKGARAAQAAAIDLEPAGGPAPEGGALSVEDDRVGHAGGDDVGLGCVTDDARLGHQQHAVDREREPVPADDREPRPSS